MKIQPEGGGHSVGFVPCNLPPIALPLIPTRNPVHGRKGTLMTRKEWEALVEYTLNIGRQMLECGAEAWRAENAMARILRAYGLEVQDAHVIATQAAVTVKTPEGGPLHQHLHDSPEKTGTDLERLEILNAAARRICEATPAPGPAPLGAAAPRRALVLAGVSGVYAGAGAFGVFFGGSLLDGVASGSSAV